MKNIVVVFAFLFSPLGLHSQSVENLKTTFQDNRAIITYDLIGNDSYYIEIYSSKDTFTNKIRFAIGDIGKGINPGLDKKIIINLVLEKLVIDDNLEFQINAVSESIVQISQNGNSLSDMDFKVKDLRRGKTNELYWPATNTTLRINLELYKDGKLFYPIASNIANSGFYSWKTLKSLPVGSYYQIQIVETSNSINLVRSNMFMIKPQIPTIIKVLAGVGGTILVGGLLYYGLYY